MNETVYVTGNDGNRNNQRLSRRGCYVVLENSSKSLSIPHGLSLKVGRIYLIKAAIDHTTRDHQGNEGTEFYIFIQTRYGADRGQLTAQEQLTTLGQSVNVNVSLSR
jgi:hypothetical protein